MLYVLVFFCFFSFSAVAQQDRDAIRGAAATASRGVGGARGLPPDSMKWRAGGDVSISFSQVNLTNWIGGGENSLSFSGSSNLFANYKKNRLIWENYAFMSYGMIKAGEREAIKNTDQLTVGSRFGLQRSNDWYYAAAFLGRSQFAPGFRYSANDTVRISDFLAPVNMFFSLGMDYKPSSRLSVSLAPAMGKITYVRSTNEMILASGGIPEENREEGKNTNYEFGGGIVVSMNGNFFQKRVSYGSQLELFMNYFKDNPFILDVIWDFNFRIALTQFISAQLRLNMRYFENQKTYKQNPITLEREEHPAQLQVNQFFEIGLFYAF